MKTLTALLAFTALAIPASSAAAEPALTVPQATLDASVKCVGPALKGTKLTPILLVTGLGATGDEAYNITKGAFEAYGHPVCYANFPEKTTADLQVAAQYLVNAIRSTYTQSGKKIAVLGFSTGAVITRWGLTWWPSLQSKVSDVVSLAGIHHGSSIINTNYTGKKCSPDPGCPPAVWQQAAGSKFLKALNAYPDETPGSGISWTSLRSSTDEFVQPSTGKTPTSSLKGATNILFQDVCKGRKTSHVGTLLDSVSFEVLKDAIKYSGPAKVSRLPKTVCTHPFATGLDAGSAWVVLAVAPSRLQNLGVPVLAAEPSVASYALKK